MRKDKNFNSVAKIGFTGEGKYNIKEYKKAYSLWNSILDRCYGNNKLDCYKNVTVCKEWHNFQVFAEWFEANYNPELMKGWHLDKDLFSKKDKIYSPNTCCFLPLQINCAITNKHTAKDLPKGVIFYKGAFVVQIGSKYLGRYKTVEEAEKVHKKHRKEQIILLANEWQDKISNKIYKKLLKFKV